MGDFVSIETLRLFQPRLYRSIRQNKANLCNNDQSAWNARNERSAEFDRLFLQPIPEHERTRYRRVLMRLFPFLEGVWDNVHYSGEDRWAKERRVCSTTHFDAYFRFSLGDDVLRRSEIDLLIEKAGDEDFIATALRAALQITRNSGGTKAALILDELLLHADRVSVNDIQPLLSTIFSLGDELNVEADKARGFAFGANRLRIRWLLRRLTDRLSLSERSAIFIEACSKASIGWLAYFVRLAYSEYYPREGKKPSVEADCLTTLEDAKALKTLLLQRVVKAAKSDELLATPDLPYLLYQWAEWAEDDGATVKDWTTSQLADDKAVASFAAAFTSYSWSQGLGFGGLGDLVALRTTLAQVNHLDQIMDREQFRYRLEEIEHKGDGAVSESVKQFLEAWRRQERSGED